MVLFATSQWASICLVGAILIFTITLLIRLRRYRARQKKSQPLIVRTHRPDASQRGHHLGLPDEALQWEVQMHETARDLSGQLDSKMSALGHLIAEADRAAARLEAALAGAGPAENSGEPGEKLGATSPASPEQHEQVYTLADYGFDPTEIARRVRIAVAEVEQMLSRREDRQRRKKP